MHFNQLAKMIKSANTTQLIEIKEGFETGLKEYLSENRIFNKDEKNTIMENLTPDALKEFLDGGFTKEETLYWVSKGYQAGAATKFIEEFNGSTPSATGTDSVSNAPIDTVSTGTSTMVTSDGKRVSEDSILDLPTDRSSLIPDEQPTSVTVPDEIEMDKAQLPEESPDGVDIFSAPEFDDTNPDDVVKESKTLREAPEDEDINDTEGEEMPDDIEGLDDTDTDEDNGDEDEEMEDKSVICFYVDEEEMEEILGEVKDEGEPTEGAMGAPMGGEEMPMGGEEEMPNEEEMPEESDEFEEPESEEEEKPMEGYRKKLNRILKEANGLIQNIKSTGLIVTDPRSTLKKLEGEQPKGEIKGNIEDVKGAKGKADAEKKRVTDGEASVDKDIPNKYRQATSGSTVVTGKTVKENALKTKLESYKKEVNRLKRMNESLIKDLIIAEEASKLNDATKEQIKEAVRNIPVKDCPMKVKTLVEAHLSRLNTIKSKKFTGIGASEGSLMESVQSTNSGKTISPVLQRMLDLASDGNKFN